MPTTLDAVERSLPGLAPAIFDRIVTFVQGSSQPFRELVDRALELLAGVVPSWPLLAEWNRWCLANRATFAVWQPRQEGLAERQQLEALLHTIMMIAAKQRNVATFLGSRVAEVEVLMAGDDCVICDEHRHRTVPLSDSPIDQLAPFHPGCRCGMLPRFK